MVYGRTTAHERRTWLATKESRPNGSGEIFSRVARLRPPAGGTRLGIACRNQSCKAAPRRTPPRRGAQLPRSSVCEIHRGIRDSGSEGGKRDASCASWWLGNCEVYDRQASSYCGNRQYSAGRASRFVNQNHEICRATCRLPAKCWGNFVAKPRKCREHSHRVEIA